MEGAVGRGFRRPDERYDQGVSPGGRRGDHRRWRLSAYIELTYTRRVDDRDVHLLAVLPTVRPLSIGGNPSDLRLPGVAAGASYAVLAHTDGHFTIERDDAGDRVRINDDALDDAPRELHDGDIIAIEGFCLQFHEGELPDGEMLFETPLRWKLRIPGVVQHGESIELEDASTPYINEFQTLAQPLWQVKDFAAIEREAARELRRIDRLDEAEQLSRYCQALWRARITASARAERAEEAEQLCREAIALFPDSAPLLVWLGMSLLRRRQWAEAADAFRRAQRSAEAADLYELHVARLGVRLAQDEPARNWAAHPSAELPPLRVDATGDEALFFYLARTNNVFGSSDFVQFRFLGRALNDAGTESTERWDILDQSTGVSRHRRVIAPGLPWADPSLLTEVALVAKMLARDNPEWTSGIIDASEETRLLRREPVQVDSAAVDWLCRLRPAEEPYLRFWTASVSGQEILKIGWQSRPHAGDIVYQQGGLRVAVEESVVYTVLKARLEAGRVRRRPVLILRSQRLSPIIIDRIGGASLSGRRRGGLANLTAAALIILGASLIGRTLYHLFGRM